MVRSTHRFCLILLLGFFVFGCSDDDDGGTGPGNTTTGSQDSDAMVKAGTQALDFAVDLSALITEWANGDLVVPPRPSDGLAKEATWSEELQAWLLQYDKFEDLTPPNNAGVNVGFQIQYFTDAGGIQQSHQGAEGMNVTIMFLYSEGLFQDSDNNSTFSVDLEGMLFVNGLDTGQRTISGLLGGSLISEGVRGGESYEVVLSNLRLMPALDIPVGGCPQGEISMSHSSFLFYVFFDGASNYNWALTGANEQTLASDSGSLDCGD